MLIIALLKGVPARTTAVVQVGGVLNREAMDIVLNPHDSKSIEAADFVKRRVGGKIVALSMGPDTKLIPIMKPLYDAEVYGVDEVCILSDRKMAGSDTLATSYAVSLGVQKILERHVRPFDELAEAVKKLGYSEPLKNKAAEQYRANLLPNKIYSELPSVGDSTIQRFMAGALTPEEAVAEIDSAKRELSRFIIVSGIKTTDGETGSVGPQVAEAVSERLGTLLPHATYVEDFDVDPLAMTVESERKIGFLSQRLVMRLPALLTIDTGYRPREPGASGQLAARGNNFRGKILQAFKWTADDLGADPTRLGLGGSPTIVGPGIDIGKPPVQKFVGKSWVFAVETAQTESDGQKFGPYSRGDLADGLPPALLDSLKAAGTVVVFDHALLAEELFK